jgi:hypothetical protein
MARTMALTSGTRLGPYEIQSPLGAGGIGEVYRALDTRLQRIVAVKILPSHLSENPEAKERFDREARTISSLNHPNICTLHDVGHQDGTYSYTDLALSPGGTRLAATRIDPKVAGGEGGIWLLDLIRGMNTRFTFDGPGFHTGLVARWRPSDLRGNSYWREWDLSEGYQWFRKRAGASPCNWRSRKESQS